ncbi:MAG: hypothetical protein HZA78_09050 [Candidatus Schekmanbacteria bacterium]|nr:hypothetical protein [Candidatus Schekmanbacteria bacterium]
MALQAIPGIYHNGKIELLEKIQYIGDKKVIIVFIDELEDQLWEETAAKNFFAGYSKQDAVYDKL